ncbi:DUF397 domain-containing protein [Streptomyces sp. IMTB 2501]|uniref:DUF397 domain-containing protein n=1 Tax=Streptomyces sp. IMTB 2501 TaxID=1776340 RepID=UPI00096EF5E8|nr:DUF397 domain-containing protein [Streptomyces sp. IMTB 2501]OLZ65083.1 DUF397 domain-containing protein [Streptomyces sp. IMTB 2501]
MTIEQLTWFKSSYSSAEGGQCVELAHNWRKSMYSTGGGGECLETATHPTAIHIRDSKRPTAPHLTLSLPTWSAFLASVPGRDRIGNAPS